MKKSVFIGIFFVFSLLITGCSLQAVVDDAAYIYSKTDVVDDTVGLDSETDYAQDYEILVSAGYAFIEFSTLENFLTAIEAIQTDGDDIASLVEDLPDMGRDSYLENVMERTKLQSIETLYLPIGIPEEFEIRRVTVSEHYIAFRYLPREIVPASRDEFWLAMTRSPSFEFTISRKQIPNQLDAILERDSLCLDDLIDGKYLFLEPNLFVWESDGRLITLYITTRSNDDGRNDTPLDMVRFTETLEIDLQDVDAVRDVIAEISN